LEENNNQIEGGLHDAGMFVGLADDRPIGYGCLIYYQ
jgi:hypothetical protein